MEACDAAAIKVRTDYTSEELRRFARAAEGGSGWAAFGCCTYPGRREQERATRIAGVALQIVRDWGLRFNESAPEELATGEAPGRAPILNDERRARLAEIVEAGPVPAAHGAVR